MSASKQSTHPLARVNNMMVLRARPHQARSQETFDKILAAAAGLLDEVGWGVQHKLAG